MTDASSFYTLARRVGGNIGYSLVAVLLDRGVTFHRTQLAEHTTALDPATQQALSNSIHTLKVLGINALHATKLAYAMLKKSLVQQATMLADNDISFIFGCLFFILAPMALMLPGIKK